VAFHKSESGKPIPSYEAAQEEIEAIARGLDDAGGGLVQFVPDLISLDSEPALRAVFDVAAEVGLPVTFTLAVGNGGEPYFRNALTMVEKANAEGGDVTAQIFPRPIGLIIGLELTGNPFVLYPGYREIAGLPLAERVAEMRKPEVRMRILNDRPAGDGQPLMFMMQAWDYMYPLGDPPNYEPDPSESIGARARARGVSPLEEAYDRRRARDVLGGVGQLSRPVARYGGRVAPPRRRCPRLGRWWRTLRNDL
jgi:N-acyl-D-aspartate/D-glutamate deacylase